MRKFAFIIPMRNAHKTLEQTLRSLIAQSHSRWRAIIIDDASDSLSVETSKALVNKTNEFLNDERVLLVQSDVRRWETENVYVGLQLCTDDEIACRLDADDWLTDADALSIISDVYDKTGCDALWTQHRWNCTHVGISAAMAPSADPYTHKWVSSHMKTWDVKLSRGVNVANYKNQHGEWVRRAGDQAIYLPVLKRARARMFLPLVTYHYSIDIRPETFASEDAKLQKAEADFIRARGYVE